jgi:hypothetical protein
LNNQKVALTQQLQKIKMTSDNGSATLELTKEVFLTASQAKKEFLNSKNDKKRLVLEKLLWNLEIQNKEIACVSYKMPYEILKKSPKNDDFSNLLGVEDKTRNQFSLTSAWILENREVVEGKVERIKKLIIKKPPRCEYTKAGSTLLEKRLHY